jgi:hypothetical protein
MKSSEQVRLIEVALEILGVRCSFDPHWKRKSQEALQEELQDADLDERLFSAWPADWPTQELVELDNIGDPGAWLQTEIGERIFEVLFGSVDYEQVAEHLAQAYLDEIQEQGYPLPSDFEEGLEDWEEAKVRQEFVAFFRHWHARVLQVLESQRQSGDEA